MLAVLPLLPISSTTPRTVRIAQLQLTPFQSIKVLKDFKAEQFAAFFWPQQHLPVQLWRVKNTPKILGPKCLVLLGPKCPMSEVS